MTILPEKLIIVDVEELPSDKRPKYKIGDLILIRPGSDKTVYGFYLKDGMAVIAEILPYRVVGFDYYSPQPIYMIEYKVKRVDKDEYCYVLETSIQLVEADK